MDTENSDLCSIIKCSNCCLRTVINIGKLVPWLVGKEENIRKAFSDETSNMIKGYDIKEMDDFLENIRNTYTSSCFFYNNGCVLHNTRVGTSVRSNGCEHYLCNSATHYKLFKDFRINLDKNIEFFKGLIGDGFYLFNHGLGKASIFIDKFMYKPVNQEKCVQNRDKIVEYLQAFNNGRGDKGFLDAKFGLLDIIK